MRGLSIARAKRDLAVNAAAGVSRWLEGGWQTDGQVALPDHPHDLEVTVKSIFRAYAITLLTLISTSAFADGPFGDR